MIVTAGEVKSGDRIATADGELIVSRVEQVDVLSDEGPTFTLLIFVPHAGGASMVRRGYRWGDPVEVIR